MSWLRWLKKGDSPRLKTARFVVFDTETTGLNPHQDEAIALGAVAINHAAIALNDQFYSTLRTQANSKPQAALAHRLGQDTVQQAPEAEAVLQNFIQYVNAAPSLAYHCAFDDQILKRAYKRSALSYRWPDSIDVAHWLLWLHPELGPQPPSLDRALAYARIRPVGASRHNALADAMLTAQLVLWLIPSTLARVNDWDELRKRIKITNTLRQARH